jgi:hypothetical protein
MPSVNQTSYSQQNCESESERTTGRNRRCREQCERCENQTQSLSSGNKSKHAVELSDSRARRHSNQTVIAGQQVGRPPIIYICEGNHLPSLHSLNESQRLRREVQHRGTVICTPRNLQMWRADAAATDLGALKRGTASRKRTLFHRSHYFNDAMW